MTDFGPMLMLVAIIWIGWPLHSLATDIHALRKIAEDQRRRAAYPPNPFRKASP